MMMNSVAVLGALALVVGLGLEAQGRPEDNLNLQGTLEVRVDDSFEFKDGASRAGRIKLKKSSTKFIVHDDAGEQTTLDVPKRLEGDLAKKAGQEVVLKNTSAQALTVLASTPKKVVSGPAIGTVLRRGPAPYNVLAVILESPVRTAPTVGFVRDNLFGSKPSLRTLFEGSSNRKATVQGDVVGPFPISSACPGAEDPLKLQKQAIDAVEAAYGTRYDFRNYDSLLIVAASLEDAVCAGPDHATITKAPVVTKNFGTVKIATAWMHQIGNDQEFQFLVAHELGHNMGLVHASTYQCMTGGFSNTDVCGTSEYGDAFDIMGGNFDSRAFSVFQKRKLGWLPSTVTKEVEGSGTFLMRSGNETVQGIEEFSQLSLVLPRPSKWMRQDVATHLTLEYWSDLNTPFGDYYGDAYKSGGVLLRFWQGGYMDNPYIATLLDENSMPHPVVIEPGQEYFDAQNGIRISVEKREDATGRMPVTITRSEPAPLPWKVTSIALGGKAGSPAGSKCGEVIATLSAQAGHSMVGVLGTTIDGDLGPVAGWRKTCAPVATGGGNYKCVFQDVDKTKPQFIRFSEGFDLDVRKIPAWSCP